MESNKKLIILLFTILVISFPTITIQCKINLPELATKQDIINLRFISNDGRFTYYQQSSGKLFLSTNYNVHPVLISPKHTNYLLISSETRKRILVEKNEIYHTYYGIRTPNTIYFMSFGKKDIKKLGSGINAQLHLQDQWSSFYQAYNGLIKFINLENTPIKFQIKLINKINPYFIPEVAMTSSDIIYFTDLNYKGFSGIIEFKRSKNKTRPVFKADSHNQRIELCLAPKHLYVGVFGIDDIEKGSKIIEFERKNISFKKNKIIYFSELNDLGHIICSQKEGIYFVKNVSQKKGKDLYEVALLNKGAKKAKIISNVKYATNIIEMDGMIFLPFRNKYYIIKGRQDFKSDNIFRKNDEKPQDKKKK